MSSPNRRVGIFVATMTGLAEMCGEEVEKAFVRAGFACDRMLMDGLDASAFASYDVLVVISSTYGHGEIPDNGQELFAALEAGADLTGKQYAVFGLGDRTYSDTFCAAGDRWDAALASRGAHRVGEVQRHDASGGTFAEDVAAEWAVELSQTLIPPANDARGAMQTAETIITEANARNHPAFDWYDNSQREVNQ